MCTLKELIFEGINIRKFREFLTISRQLIPLRYSGSPPAVAEFCEYNIG